MLYELIDALMRIIISLMLYKNNCFRNSFTIFANAFNYMHKGHN